jgi:ParB family chromosome partitioning protein
MLPVEKVQPNPDQPRKTLGDLRELTESIREKGVLEPLLVRFVSREDTYYIISGERRYHAARAAGLREVPCIEKIADDAQTLEIALVENLQRKDLTPFEEAEGLARLAQQFDYTHEEIARKIARSRVSVTETLSLCAITGAVRKRCIEHGLVSKSLLLQVARQPNEKKMLEMAERIARGRLTRDEARAERRAEKSTPQRPRPFVFQFAPETRSFRMRMEFQKSQVSKAELVLALRAVLSELEAALRTESETAA